MMKYIKEMAVGMLILLGSCTKYLEAVPDNGLTVPKTVADFEQLLQNESMFVAAPAIGEFGTDDFYMPDALLATQSVTLRNSYVWANDIYEGATSAHWNNMYVKIYNTNIVLEGIEKLPANDVFTATANEIKGWALFCRAHALFDLAQVFAQPYKPQSAASDLGIPLRLNSDLLAAGSRASVAETYKQILLDLNTAIPLLTTSFAKTSRNRPGRAAGYALLARVLLTMQDYRSALAAANNSLQVYNVLLDYNLANAASAIPFSPLIDEVTYISTQISAGNRNWQVERKLYDSFESNDLRKTLFFTYNASANTVVFKGYYSDAYAGFNGLSTDEQYLIKAECEARLGALDAALNTLNSLLITRYKKGTYVPYTTVNTLDVLGLVLLERRKQCIYRNLRWSDLRRLNQDERFAVTIRHTVGGLTYQLLPNDLRYTLPIPDDEIRSSGIAQNSR